MLYDYKGIIIALNCCVNEWIDIPVVMIIKLSSSSHT